jgi:predicted RND superfamily exporter protein
VIAAAGLFLVSLCLLPSLRWGGNFVVESGADSPGLTAQNLLSSKYGIEGSPDVLLIAGSEEEVLSRAENLTSGLEEYQRKGVVKSVFSPTQLLPSVQMQAQRAASLKGIDLDAAARALKESLAENGFRLEPYASYFARLHQLSQGAQPLTLEGAETYLPADLMENSIRRTADGSYVAAIAFYAADPNATSAVPDPVLKQWRDRYGPFVDFSFNKIDRDLESRVSHDSRRALLWTAAAIFLIVYFTFRRLSTALLVLMPIAFAIVVTFGLLELAGHRFSMMAITALPLIVGIGIDNGIHLVRRYLESDRNRILTVAKASGAALIQSNLTTIVGFGALMTATFRPLAEMGLVTSVGVALTLAGGFWLIPAILHLKESAKGKAVAADL